MLLRVTCRWGLCERFLLSNGFVLKGLDFRLSAPYRSITGISHSRPGGPNYVRGPLCGGGSCHRTGKLTRDRGVPNLSLHVSSSLSNKTIWVAIVLKLQPV